MLRTALTLRRTTAVLFDPATSADSYRNRVAYVVAHELAHQWFGNLVTMDWWSELWLNEGFATWVGWLAIDHLYPGRTNVPQIPTHVLTYIQTGMSGDSLLYVTSLEVATFRSTTDVRVRLIPHNKPSHLTLSAHRIPSKFLCTMVSRSIRFSTTSVTSRAALLSVC